MDKPLLVLDGGFFSEENILGFLQTHTKFLMRGQLDSKWILPELKPLIAKMEMPSHACPEDPSKYCATKRIRHMFSYERRQKKKQKDKET